MSTSDEFDPINVGGALAPPDKVEALTEAVEEALALEEAVAQMEDDLKAAKKALHALKGSRLPDLMSELGVERMDFQGWEVSVTDFVSGSFPKAGTPKHEPVKAWLENEGAGSLLKTSISLSFGKSQHNEALDLAARLESEGHPITVDSGVHPQSLQAFARQRIRDGEPLDTELLGLYIGKAAKIKRAKQ